MVKARLFLVCAMLASLSGCVYSIHPILSETDLTNDIDLTGSWRQQVDDPKHEPMVISCEGYADNTSYDVTFAGKEFTLQVGKVGSHRYLQFIRTDMPPEAPPVLTALPVYGFARFEMHGDAMHVFPVHNHKGPKLFADKKVPLKHYKPSDMVEFFVLTQVTSELQSLLRESGDAIISDKPMVFQRLKH